MKLMDLFGNAGWMLFMIGGLAMDGNQMVASTLILFGLAVVYIYSKFYEREKK